MASDQEKQEFRRAVEEALVPIRGGIAMHSGGVDIVDVDPEKGIVYVRLTGMCVGCPFAGDTLRDGIADVLMSVVPEVREVVAVEDELKTN